jgi:hypothetical protein
VGAINYQTWLERLGLKRTDAPEQVHVVQPVNIVADTSVLVSPIIPPSCVVGGQRAQVAAVFGAAEIHSRAAGGTLVSMILGMAGTGNWITVHQAGAATMANLLTLVRHENNAAEPCQAGVRIGTMAALISQTQNPLIRGLSGDQVQNDMYIPTGRFGIIEFSSSNIATTFHLTITDLPGPNAQ